MILKGFYWDFYTSLNSILHKALVVAGSFASFFASVNTLTYSGCVFLICVCVCAETEDTDLKHADDVRKRQQRQTYVKRVIVHPSFHNISFKDAEKLMESMDQGDVVIRPSSKVEMFFSL